MRQIPPGGSPAPDVLNAVFMGLAIAQDNRTLYVSGGNDGNIAVFDLASGARTATIDLNVPAGGRAWKDSYIGDLKLAPDGKTFDAQVTEQVTPQHRLEVDVIEITELQRNCAIICA